MASNSQLETLRILLVDDASQMRRLVSDVLSHLGFRLVESTDDGRQALKLVSERSYDLIITDWRMPEIEGIELVRFIRNDPACRCPHVPIIMLSGNTESNYILQARDTGVNEYMIKPFSASQLVRRIRAIIEQPRPFIEAPAYHGPDRRWHNVPLDHTLNDRRQGTDPKKPRPKF